MNTKGLTGLYDRLTPLERLPLIMAAMERGDELEADRLSRSAPRIALGLPNYHGLGEGVLLLSLFHMVEQLDLGLVFWRAQSMAAEWETFPVGPEDQERVDRLWDCVHMFGYRLCMEADAWRLVCAEMHADPEALLRDIRGFDSLRDTEKLARALLWTPEEAAAFLRKISVDETEVPTLERSAQNMRDLIDQRIRFWDGD